MPKNGSVRSALEQHESRSPEAQRADESRTAERVVEPTEEGYEEWSENPSKSDYPGVDTGPDHDEGRVIDKMGYMKPITDHRLEATAEAGLGIAEAAGFGGHQEGGFDTLEGIDKMVTGEVDAMAEMRTESWTEGGPLEIGPSEDFRRAILPEYDLIYDDPGDWTEYL